MTLYNPIPANDSANSGRPRRCVENSAGFPRREPVAINIIDMTSFSKVALLASPTGLRFEDDPKARTGRLSEALQRIG